MMIMTLCLMVYNIAQYRLREALVEKKETLPNQINKPIKIQRCDGFFKLWRVLV